MLERPTIKDRDPRFFDHDRGDVPFLYFDLDYDPDFLITNFL